MYQVSLKIFDCVKGKIILASWWERNWKKIEGKGLKLTIMWCLHGGGQKKELESDKENMLKSMVAQMGENVLFIRFLLWHCFRVVWCSQDMVRSNKMDVVLYGLFWKWPQIVTVCGIFCNAFVWLEWLGKNWRCV